MHPIITLFGLQLPAYGLCSVAGFAAGVALSVRYAKTHASDGERMLYACLAVFLAALAGGVLMRALYQIPALLRGEMAGLSLGETLERLFTGTRYFGFIAGGWFVAAVMCRRLRVNPAEMVYVCMPAVPLIEAFVRLGCLLSGCCYGVPWSGPFAMTFPPGGDAPPGVPLFPWQLSALLMNLLLLTGMLILRRRSPGVDPPRWGCQIGSLYLLGYGLMRFVLEFFRGDGAGDMLLGLNTAQWFCLAMAATGAARCVYDGRRWGLMGRAARRPEKECETR